MFERFKNYQSVLTDGAPWTAAGGTGASEADKAFDLDLKRRILDDTGPVPEGVLPEPLTVAPAAGALVVNNPDHDDWLRLKRTQIGPGSVFAQLGRSCEEPAAAAFDILRTQVLQMARTKGAKRIGVVAPTSGCGATFTALNLACGLARIENFRTLLVDMNQRAPAVHRALDVPWQGRIADFLNGKFRARQYTRKVSDTLGLILNAHGCETSADQLHGATAAGALADTMDSLRPDLMIYDLPPVLEYDDLLAFAPQLDAVLLVADGRKTKPSEILRAEKLIAGHVPLMGVVLNKATRG